MFKKKQIKANATRQPEVTESHLRKGNGEGFMVVRSAAAEPTDSETVAVEWSVGSTVDGVTIIIS